MDKTIENIIFPIKDELNIFEKNLYDLIDKQDIFLKEELKNFIFSSPKRLRAIFIFLFRNILKIENDDDILNIAIATELFHSASLIHDDIIDEEKSRRKSSCLYIDVGIKKAILNGDFLLSLGLLVLSKINYNVVKIFSDKIYETIKGELFQNEFTDKILSKEMYLKKTYEKTAPLFIAPLLSLFTLKKIKTDIRKNLLDFVSNFSIAFQIKNDIENIEKSKTDIKNGNYTLPVIYFFMENKVADFDNLSYRKLKKYLLISNKDVLNYKNIALKSLDNIQNSIYKQIFKDICEFYFGE